MPRRLTLAVLLSCLVSCAQTSPAVAYPAELRDCYVTQRNAYGKILLIRAPCELTDENDTNVTNKRRGY